MTLSLLLVIVLTALSSAGLTLGIAYWVFQRRYASQFEARLEAIQDEFEQRVKRGVYAAGEQLMPDLRENVRRGFQDVLSKTETAEMMESYASAVNRGTDIISNRLGSLFGIKPRK